MSEDGRVVIGIDGGGTRTRALVADLSGRVLAFFEGGPASPERVPNPEENVRPVIREVLQRSGRPPEAVAALVAGIAGLDVPEAQEWAERLTAVPGISAPRRHVNDAVVAHAGALGSRPGIIVISGTGSVVYARLPDGSEVRNYDFLHYARAAARQLAQEALFLILAGRDSPGDAAFLDRILAYWKVANVQELHDLGRRGFVADRFARDECFGRMAPLVTAAALEGSPLARRVCDEAVGRVLSGIRMVAGCFRERPIPVALIGGVAGSPYMRRAFEAALQREGEGFLQLVEPGLPGAAGAVLLALEDLDIPASTVRGNLERSVGGCGCE